MDNPPGPKSYHQILLFFSFSFFRYNDRLRNKYLLKSIPSIVRDHSIPIRHQTSERRDKTKVLLGLDPHHYPWDQIIPPPLPPDPWSYRSRENALMMMSRERHLTGDVTPPTTTGQSRGIQNPYIPSHTSHPIPYHPIPRASMMIYTRTRVG